MTQQLYRIEAKSIFRKASRRAFWNRLLSKLDGEQTGLLDFNAVSSQLHLKTAVYRGRQEVPTAQIIGSMGRYDDFTGTFLPVNNALQVRWESIARGYLNPTSGGIPPVELFQIGTSYFVRDGNHRVSVANQLGIALIEAFVWEYPAPIAGLGDDVDIDALLLENERREFLEQTNIDTLRPDHHIRMTEPGGYTDLLCQITYYQHALSKIDETPTEHAYAVEMWYDLLYETTCQLVADCDIMTLFPERTLADFYVWTMRYQDDLRAKQKRRSIDQIMQDVRSIYQDTWLNRLWKRSVATLRRALVQ